MRTLRFLFIFIFIGLCRLLFRFEVNWVNDKPLQDWSHIRLFIFLHHTSLFEPIFIATMPLHFIWHGAKHALIPVAEKTLNRPFVGRFFKLLTPHMTSITRKRDETWTDFLKKTDKSCLIVIAPEGRMMRKTGLDAEGNPMSVRGGIADILEALGCHDDRGEVMFAYSGGLHHIQAPGEKLPRLFKTAKIRYEVMSIAEYKSLFKQYTPRARKLKVVEDLEQRMEKHRPSQDQPSTQKA